MTRDELKFALNVENVMNTVPEPEYRQMLVEALVVLAAFASEQTLHRLDDTVDLAAIVTEANRIFLEEQGSVSPKQNDHLLNSILCNILELETITFCIEGRRLKRKTFFWGGLASFLENTSHVSLA